LVVDFEVDDHNAAKFAVHGIREEQVFAVLERPFAVIRNRAERATEYLLIGRDRSGQCIAIPLLPTNDPTVWRPVTAWHCKRQERARLPRER
jgi:uncharacterized DUF497 family protein